MYVCMYHWFILRSSQHNVYAHSQHLCGRQNDKNAENMTKRKSENLNIKTNTQQTRNKIYKNSLTGRKTKSQTDGCHRDKPVVERRPYTLIVSALECCWQATVSFNIVCRIRANVTVYWRPPNILGDESDQRFCSRENLYKWPLSCGHCEHKQKKERIVFTIWNVKGAFFLSKYLTWGELRAQAVLFTATGWFIQNWDSFLLLERYFPGI